MAEDGMSIVPYGSNLDVVLYVLIPPIFVSVLILTNLLLNSRHNDSIVCLDRDSQELVLRNTAQSNGDLELADCPTATGPWGKMTIQGKKTTIARILAVSPNLSIRITFACCIIAYPAPSVPPAPPLVVDCNKPRFQVYRPMTRVT